MTDGRSTTGLRARADRAAVLVDASSYYAALRTSLLDARRSVFIAGWDVDSRTPVRGAQQPDDGAPELLGPLLSELVKRRRSLEVFVLLWDYSVLYIPEREPMPRLNLDWRTPKRIHVCLDAHLPLGASHHEKLVVVDNAVAYCGGLDLTIRRWDTPAHDVHNDLRVDPGGAPYGPFHDAQWVVDGEVAAALGELLRERWQSIDGRGTPPSERTGRPWPEGVEPAFEDIDVHIVRTVAAFEATPGRREIETAYTNAIARAQRLIYIESQYLTAGVIAEALDERLEACDTLEVLIVSSVRASGWLEDHTMNVGRCRFIKRLERWIDAGRLRIVYPYVADDGENVAVKVHTKLMIVDDATLELGSANLNNRSMCVDTETDLLVVAETTPHREAIRALRRALMAEHLGLDAAEVERREAACGSVLDLVDRARSDTRGLRPVEQHEVPDDLLSTALTQVADPEKPLDPEHFVGDLFGGRRVRPMLRRALKLASVPAALLAVALVWRTTSLSEWLSIERVAPLLDTLSATPWGGPIVLAIFVVSNVVVFPVTVLIAATALAFGAWYGFLWALAGSLLSAISMFAVGRWLGRPVLERMAGERIDAVAQRLARGGLVAVFVMRNVPIAPYTIINIAAGASPIRVRDFLLGTLLGMGPGIAALIFLGDRLRGVWQHPTFTNVASLAAAVGLWITLVLALQSLSNRLARRSARE